MPNTEIQVYTTIDYSLANKCSGNVQNFVNQYAWQDIVRLSNNLKLLDIYDQVIQLDMDCIMEKNIEPILDLGFVPGTKQYDIIISTEIGKNKSFPKECSQILGFGVCSGFYCLRKSSKNFMNKILELMCNKKYNSFSDQVTLMNYIVNSKYEIKEESITWEPGNHVFTNRIIHLVDDDIKICVLDFDIVTRDPILLTNQFVNHINVDNVGGIKNFIKYFYNKLETLPLTCRCGKLGDTTPVCPHLEIRNKMLNS